MSDQELDKDYVIGADAPRDLVNDWCEQAETEAKENAVCAKIAMSAIVTNEGYTGTSGDAVRIARLSFEIAEAMRQEESNRADQYYLQHKAGWLMDEGLRHKKNKGAA